MAKQATGTRSVTEDLQDSPQDQQKMQREEFEIEMPDVSDIPGQEHIRVAPLGELADTTISSDDEEGVGILDDVNEDELDDTSNVSTEERQDLEDSADVTDGEDASNLQRARLDNTDEDGDELEESYDVSGSDLDIPGAELDDQNEEIGAEDEENNTYGIGSDDNDNANEGTP